MLRNTTRGIDHCIVYVVETARSNGKLLSYEFKGVHWSNIKVPTCELLKNERERGSELITRTSIKVFTSHLVLRIAPAVIDLHECRKRSTSILFPHLVHSLFRLSGLHASTNRPTAFHLAV